MGSVEPAGQVLVLGKSRVWPFIAGPGAAAAVMIVVGVLLHVVSWFGIAAVAIAVAVALTRRRNAVMADEVGILVSRRGSLQRSYAWADIERIGWRDAGWWGSTLAVCPRGGPYAVPGPNSPTDVARIWHPRRPHLADPLPELMERHGIKPLSEF